MSGNAPRANILFLRLPMSAQDLELCIYALDLTINSFPHWNRHNALANFDDCLEVLILDPVL